MGRAFASYTLRGGFEFHLGAIFLIFHVKLNCLALIYVDQVVH